MRWWLLFIGIVGAGVLAMRWSIIASNRCAGVRKQPEIDDEELDEWIGYRTLKHAAKQPISTPGFAESVALVMGQCVVVYLAYLLLSKYFRLGSLHVIYRNDGPPLLLLMIGLSMLISFPISAWLFKAILSTSYGRACLVLFWFNIAIAAIAVPLFAIVIVVLGR